ncbi:DNA-formamidopyrimidine glycosylase family protein [Dyadobacter luticola]|uniref:Endonuclease n=1 Tax=Dyadobacter luticola TaxID=1979387 RepID=A0A5R9L2E2_9BACT|nr:DNA-formamidopyrimidine glycosylase family protein [Dyadobacter luticola]TLV02557.1 endonuclease [Dyadobacter luticola]
MPEGPSIVILKEMVCDLHLRRKAVQQAEGYAKIDMDRLVGETVLDFKSWGKHFLICFKDFTVSIHLMLFGSYTVDERKKQNPRLRLVFDTHEINFYVANIKILDKPAEELYDWSGDIMSEHWSPATALKKLKGQPKALACDALLDQDIFAGSGNIIKNEVLFRARVHPMSKVGEIPDKKLKEIIRETHKYAQEFLEWKKAGTLKKHWEAYTKKTCPRDKVPFHKEYIGKNKRRSYYCEVCQEKF